METIQNISFEATGRFTALDISADSFVAVLHDQPWDLVDSDDPVVSGVLDCAPDDVREVIVGSDAPEYGLSMTRIIQRLNDKLTTEYTLTAIRNLPVAKKSPADSSESS